MKLQLSPAARRDLLENLDSLEWRSKSPSIRKRFFHAFQETTALLALYPWIGRRLDIGPEAPKLTSELRVFVVRRFPKYLITYQVEETAITILRVLHGARNPELRLADPS